MPEREESRLGTAPLGKLVLSLALPSVLAQLVNLLYNIVDRVYVGHIADTGALALTGLGLCTPLILIVAAFAYFAGSGGAPRAAMELGRGDREKAGRYLAQSFLLMLVSAAVLTPLLLWLRAPLLRFFGASDDTIGFADRYIRIYLCGTVFVQLALGLNTFITAQGQAKTAMLSVVIGAAANIILDPILIFLFDMGVEGAALATVLTRVIEMLIVAFYTFRVQKVVDVRPRDFFTFDRALARDYARYGLPVGLTDMQWSFIGLLKAAIIGRLTTYFIAANAITSAMMNLGTMFTFALAGGACVMVGKAVGRGDYDTAREYSRTIQVMFALIGVCMAAVVYLLRAPFTRLYGSAQDAQVFSLATQMIAIGAVTLIGTSYHASCFVGINRGAGDSRFVAAVDMICGWLVVLPAMLIAVHFNWPLPVVFLMTRIDQCFKWLIAFLRLRGDKWIKNVTRA